MNTLSTLIFQFHKDKDGENFGHTIFSFDDGTKKVLDFKISPNFTDPSLIEELSKGMEERSLIDKSNQDKIIKEVAEEKKKKEDHKKAVQRGMEKQRERLKKQKEKETVEAPKELIIKQDNGPDSPLKEAETVSYFPPGHIVDGNLQWDYLKEVKVGE